MYFLRYWNNKESKLRYLRGICGIASGMAYLHSKGIVHGDLAARNCLVGPDIKTIKITGLGRFKDWESHKECYYNSPGQVF
jgi:serine/threonine protein kinase